MATHQYIGETDTSVDVLPCLGMIGRIHKVDHDGAVGFVPSGMDGQSYILPRLDFRRIETNACCGKDHFKTYGRLVCDCGAFLTVQVPLFRVGNGWVWHQSIPDIAATGRHDAGAFARCSGCKRYSDHPDSLGRDFACDCGKKNYFSGSFVKPDESSIWCQHEGMNNVKQT